MAGTVTVAVDLPGRPYQIHIGAELATVLPELLLAALPEGNLLLISDSTVAPLHAASLREALLAAGRRCELAVFPAGETHKHLASVESLWQACASARIDRAGAIIAVGGGVVGDVAGFVAATWMRGVAFAQVPTTLLAMVDSSVGGKTGINTSAGKNLVGAFQQPAVVVADAAMLRTMPDRDYRSGLAEILKYGIIEDTALLDWLEEHAEALAERDPAAVAHAVAASCRSKARFVIADEREEGVRAHLNYGHTFGHALERETGYSRWLHGEAVAIGMRMAIELARRLGVLDDPDLPARQDALIGRLGLPARHACDDLESWTDRLCAATGLDKKARAGRTRFVLPQRAGVMRIVTDPDTAAVRAAFQHGLSDHRL